jgi:hypothetical protein
LSDNPEVGEDLSHQNTSSFAASGGEPVEAHTGVSLEAGHDDI